MRWPYLLISSFVIYCGGAMADSPLPPPRVMTICNTVNSHCATTDPALNKTTLVERASGAVLWSVDQHIQFFRVSNDGQSMLALAGNLIPTNATKQFILFTIYRNGKPLLAVPLGELFASPATLQRTVSHLHWGVLEKIDAKDNAVFLLHDGRRVAYNLVTGQHGEV